MAHQTREAARGVLLTPDGEILLMRIAFPNREVWLTPGGGLDPGESAEQAVRRELREETSLQVSALGPHLWSRTFRFRGRDFTFEQREHFFLVPTPRFEPHFQGAETDRELEWFREFRWWKPREIEASGELFAPRGLAGLVSDLAAGEIPELPLELSR